MRVLTRFVMGHAGPANPREDAPRLWPSRMILLLTVLVGWTLVFVLKAYSSVPNVEPDHVAKTLAREGFFGDPIGVPTAPTSHLAPG